MTVQMFAFAVLLVSASAQADQCVAGIDNSVLNSDTFDAVGLLQSKTKIILQADREKIANDEEDEAVPYVKTALGGVCSATTRVTSRAECVQALKTLGMVLSHAYESGWSTLPGGCQLHGPSQGNWMGWTPLSGWDGLTNGCKTCRCICKAKVKKSKAAAEKPTTTTIAWSAKSFQSSPPVNACCHCNKNVFVLIKPQMTAFDVRFKFKGAGSGYLVKYIQFGKKASSGKPGGKPGSVGSFEGTVEKLSIDGIAWHTNAPVPAGQYKWTEWKTLPFLMKGGESYLLNYFAVCGPDYYVQWPTGGTTSSWVNGVAQNKIFQIEEVEVRSAITTKAKVKKSEAPGASKKGSKKAAVDKAAKAAKQATADKAVADASTSLRTDLKELTSTKEDLEKELKTLETHIAQTETAAQAVKSMAKNAADEMAAALKAVKKAKDEELAAKDKEAEELAKKHKLLADKLLKIAEGHKADADKAIKDLGKHQKLAKDAEVVRKKEDANKDNAASTAAQELATKTQEAANLAKAAAATAKVKAAKAKVAADVAAK